MKPINGWNNLYYITTNGEVFSNHFSIMKPIKPRITQNGYLRVALQQNGSRVDYNIHRLVAETYIHNQNNFPQINHKDGNKTNNSVDNLEWCTAKQNFQHAISAGLFKHVRGEHHGQTPLTEDDVRFIREAVEMRLTTQSALAKKYCINQSCISAIIRRKTWTHI